MAGYTQLRSDWINGEDFDAAYMNSMVRILDTQLHGALEGLGAGIISGAVASAGTGLSVQVTALKGIISTEHGLVYLQTDAALTLSGLTANSTLYLHLGAVFAVTAEDEDSRETAGGVLFVTANTSETNSTCLAQVVTGSDSVVSVTDRRTMCPVAAVQALAATLQTDLQTLEDTDASLKASLGTDYYDALGNPVTGNGTVTARLDNLEAGGLGETIYWGPLPKTAADPTSIEQFVAAQVAAHVTALHGQASAEEKVEVLLQHYDMDNVRLGRTLLRVCRVTDATILQYMPDAAWVVWGKSGDGTDAYDFVDHTNSTWVPV